MRKLIVAFLCCLFLLFPDQLSANEHNQNNVLIITSYSSNSNWGNKIICNITSETKAEELDVQYHIEYLDSDKHRLDQYKIEFEQILDKKYKKVPLDAVVTIGFDAFDFVQNCNIPNIDGATLIAGSLDYFYIKDYETKKPYIGNKTKISSEDHYNVIKALQPELSKAYFLSSGENLLAPVLEELKRFYDEQGIETEIISLKHLQKIVSENQKKSLDEAFIMSYIDWDEERKRINPIQIFDYIRNFYDGPIYFLDGPKFMDILESDVDNPPIGGLMRDRSAEGTDLGKKLVTLLTDSSQAEQDVDVLTGRVILDYKGLNSSRLDANRLSVPYEIVNAPVQDVIIPKNRLIFGLGILSLLLSIIVIFLVMAIRKNELLIKQVTQSKTRYKQLVGLLPDTVLVVKNEKIAYVNKLGLAYLEGEKFSDLVGQDASTVLKQVGELDCNGEELGRNKALIRTLKGWEKEVEIHCANYDEEGPMSLMVIHDITEQKMLRERMEYDQLRNQFFANLSHELRTPINVVLSTSQLLEKKFANNPDQSLGQYNEILRQNGYRLVRLINNLIDSTKIDAGFMEVDLSVYNIVEVTENLVLSILPFAETKGIHVIFDTEYEEVFAKLDKEKYERIILNLISNSIKYGKENGHIVVHMDCKDQWVQIKIADDGIGIPPEKLATIFEPFVQVNKSSIRNVEGSGIGLAIVKSLVDLHGGNIIVRSEEDKYTEFIIRLPEVEIKEDQLELVKSSKEYSQDAIQIELSDIDFD